MLAGTLLMLALACGNNPDDGSVSDGGAADGGAADGGAADGGSADGGTSDGGTSDGGSSDGGSSDGGAADGGAADGGAADGGAADGGSTDGGSSDGGTSDGGSSDGGSECTATVVSVSPPSGTTEVELDSLVSARLSAEDSTATIALWHATDGEVDGHSTVYDSNVVFTPTDALLEDSAYQAVMDWCGGTEVWSFNTVSDGGLPDDPVGRVYALDLATADWTEPAGVGTLLGSLIEGSLLIEVLELDSTLELRLAWTDDTGRSQDTCVETEDLSVSDLSDLPEFTAGPVDLQPLLDGNRVTFADAELAASFADDLESLEGAEISGTVDFRDWADFIEDSLGLTEVSEMCELMAGFGVTCETCADGEELCLPYLVEDIPSESSSISVSEITAADIVADPDCR